MRAVRHLSMRNDGMSPATTAPTSSSSKAWTKQFRIASEDARLQSEVGVFNAAQRPSSKVWLGFDGHHRSKKIPGSSTSSRAWFRLILFGSTMEPFLPAARRAVARPGATASLNPLRDADGIALAQSAVQRRSILPWDRGFQFLCALHKKIDEFPVDQCSTRIACTEMQLWPA